jgi:hypothetical protein
MLRRAALFGFGSGALAGFGDAGANLGFMLVGLIGHEPILHRSIGQEKYEAVFRGPCDP